MSHSRQQLGGPDLWTVFDLSDWTVSVEETRGRRTKRWMRAPLSGRQAEPHSKWLIKFPLERRHSEVAIEVFALALARVVGIDAAEGRLALAPSPAGAAHAIAVRSFIRETLVGGNSVITSALSLGHALLKSADARYDSDAHEAHTLERVREVLCTRTQDPNASLVTFAQVLMFDAWIGNGDRHQANWGILQSRDGSLTLAPMFDPAASLGAVLLDDHPLLRAEVDDAKLDKFVLKCGSGFGDGTDIIPMRDLVTQLLKQWPEALSLAPELLDRFGEALAHVVPDMMAGAPDEVWPPARRRLAATLLERRLAWLRGVVGSGGSR